MCGKDPDRNPSSRRRLAPAATVPALLATALPVLLAALLAAPAPARADENLWDKALQTLNLKATPAEAAPGFVERTRPDPADLGYIPTALPHKVSPRPVKSAAEIQAATAALDAARQRQLNPAPAPVQLPKGHRPAKAAPSAAVAD